MKKLLSVSLAFCILLSVFAHTAIAVEADGYPLQYSTVYQWDSNTMPNYNCYSYALGLTNASYNPGQFSSVPDYSSTNDDMSIGTLALMVQSDLKEGLGFDCVKVQSNCPAYTDTWDNIIAVRKDTTNDFTDNDNNERYNDYHFAKLAADGWYHKPGKTAILKFNEAPSNSVAWIVEGFNGEVYISSSNHTYDSDVMYLLYKTNHGNTTYSWTGDHYHSGRQHYYTYAYVCNDCGDYVSTVTINAPCLGPPCVMPYSVPTDYEIA